VKAGTILFGKIFEEVSLPTIDGVVLMDKKRVCSLDSDR